MEEAVTVIAKNAVPDSSGYGWAIITLFVFALLWMLKYAGERLMKVFDKLCEDVTLLKSEHLIFRKELDELKGSTHKKGYKDDPKWGI
jgi:hypothetical protein